MSILQEKLLCGYIGQKVSHCYNSIVRGSSNEPRCEKTGLWGFRPGPTQTGLYRHRRWKKLESSDIGSRGIELSHTTCSNYKRDTKSLTSASVIRKTDVTLAKETFDGK